MRNSIEYKVYGPYALFTDPITRVGGEKCTTQLPTYQAIKGITESIYWKPSITWVIDEVRVMKPIRTESKNIRLLINKDKDTTVDLAIYTYLSDVEYQVKAHFEFNTHRPELVQDHNENKHHNIAKRMIQRGGRRDIFLGTRECQAYVEQCEFGTGQGFYDGYGDLNVGWQFHGFNYPDEKGINYVGVRLWSAKMENGIITFPKPELFSENSKDYPMRIIRDGVSKKQFLPGINFEFADEDSELKVLANAETEE